MKLERKVLSKTASEEELMEAAEGHDTSKRLAAIRLMGTRPSQKQEKFLLERMQNKTITDLERIAIQTSLYRIRSEPSKQEEHVQELFNLFANSQSDSTQTQAMIQLAYLVPRDTRTREMLTRVIKDQVPKTAVPIAQRFLKGPQDPSRMPATPGLPRKAPAPGAPSSGRPIEKNPIKRKAMTVPKK